MHITSLSKNEGRVGDEVVITGTGLPGDVYFNGVLAVSEVLTLPKEVNSRISAIVPKGARTGPLTVAGGGAASEILFTVLPTSTEIAV